MGLLRMYEEWVSWESLSRIEVPKIRVYTRKSPEKEESIRSAVRRNPEVFFHSAGGYEVRRVRQAVPGRRG